MNVARGEPQDAPGEAEERTAEARPDPVGEEVKATMKANIEHYMDSTPSDTELSEPDH